MSAGFKPIDHMADVGLEVWGKTLDELFCYAAAGMSSLITSLEEIKGYSKRTQSKHGGQKDENE